MTMNYDRKECGEDKCAERGRGAMMVDSNDMKLKGDM